MYIVSYCMIVAFHPELNLLRISIFRSYDQTESEITSLSHFENIKHDFFASGKKYFNMISLKQLESAAKLVCFKENKTALAEMFNIELKFTVDCVKNWFNKNMKVLELEDDQKREFIKENNNLNLNCSICDFPLKPHVKNGGLDHVIKSEYLFLENIFTDDEVFSMELDAFEKYEEKIKEMLDKFESDYQKICCQSVEGDEEAADIIEKIKIKLSAREKEEESENTEEKKCVLLQ